MDSEPKVIAWAPSGPIYDSDKPEPSVYNNRIVTVVTLQPNHGVKTEVFAEPEPALEYFEELRTKLDSEHLIQVWDTGYKIEEGHGRARDRSGPEAVHQDDVRTGPRGAPRQ